MGYIVQAAGTFTHQIPLLDCCQRMGCATWRHVTMSSPVSVNRRIVCGIGKCEMGKHGGSQCKHGRHCLPATWIRRGERRGIATDSPAPTRCQHLQTELSMRVSEARIACCALVADYIYLFRSSSSEDSLWLCSGTGRRSRKRRARRFRGTDKRERYRCLIRLSSHLKNQASTSRMQRHCNRDLPTEAISSSGI